MNFRVEYCSSTKAYVLVFGLTGEVRFDHLGTITEFSAFGRDRQFRHTAQRLVRDAAARARTQMGHSHYGRRNSPRRLHFLQLVARIANDMEAAA